MNRSTQVRRAFQLLAAAVLCAAAAGCGGETGEDGEIADAVEAQGAGGLQATPAARCNPARSVRSSTCVPDAFLFDSARNICASCGGNLGMAIILSREGCRGSTAKEVDFGCTRGPSPVLVEHDAGER
jgi:hypothetical protein